MTILSLNRRQMLVAAAATGLAAALPRAAFAAGAFPVTLDHVFGSTTIAAPPARIVTLGWMAQDAVTALGVVPVGCPEMSWGGDANGYFPWLADALAKIGGERPQLFNVDSGTPFETILSLKPDVILAPVSGLEKDEYDRLSSIAPTVAFKGEAWTGTWQDTTRIVGAALGKSAEADAAIAATDADLAARAAAHPEFKGKTFVFGYITAGSGKMNVYLKATPRVDLMEKLGFTLAPALASRAGYDMDISAEQLADFDADVLVAWHDGQADVDYVRNDPLFSRYRPVATSHYLPIVDASMVMATAAPSTLSIAWAMDRLVVDLSKLLQA